tara:strand:- start:38 stop:856 length:819 start_codon:yes stop_codon:yes gene_type:complete
MRYLLSFLLIFATTLSSGQNILFLDSISLKPIHNLRVYHDNRVHYSDELGYVTIDNFYGENAYAIHPGYQSKEFSLKDTVLLEPTNFILPELEISAKAKPRILINKRNRHWRLSSIGISNGSIHGVSLDLEQRLVVKGVSIYFKKSLQERIYCRLVIFNTADTLSPKPTPVFGASSFDTIVKGTKKYKLNIAEYPLNNSPDTNYLVAVEFKLDESLWGESLPSLEWWETSKVNYYYFTKNHTLVRDRFHFSKLAPEMPLTTIGIEVFASKLD